MKHIIIIAFLLIGLSDSSAQYPRKWFHLQGPNIGDHSAQLLFGTNGEIISVGKLGYYQTINDGISWEYHKVVSKISCQPSYSYDLRSGFLIASSGEYFFYLTTCDTADNNVMGIYRSTDHGTTWKQVLSRMYTYSIQQWGNKLFISAGNLCYESIDKGNSWTEVFPQVSDSLWAVTDKFFFYKQSFANPE